eukprot:779918-Pleurochrysis_carterae.AAC.2
MAHRFHNTAPTKRTQHVHPPLPARSRIAGAPIPTSSRCDSDESPAPPDADPSDVARSALPGDLEPEETELLSVSLIAPLIEVLPSDNVTLQEQAAWALANLSTLHENQVQANRPRRDSPNARRA